MKKISFIFGFILALALLIGVAASVSRVSTDIGQGVLIQTGSGTTSADATVTNTFATAFGLTVVPKVIVQLKGALTSAQLATNVVLYATNTFFISKAGNASATFDYVAIGQQ